VEFSQLRIFQAVAEEGSITRAAERLHRVPSNLSTRLKQLEEQLGVELFVRERQRLQLSPAGKVLLDYTGKLFALRDQASAAVRAGNRPGICPRHAVQHRGDPFAGAVGALSQAYPAVNLQVQSGPSGELLEGLLTGRLDAALVDGPPELAGIDGVPLCEERLVLISEADHPPVLSAGTWRAGRCSPSARAAPTGCGWRPGLPISGGDGPGDGDRVLSRHACLRDCRFRGGADVGVDARQSAGP
jgi:DNA-binding transcriptional LysR family regulator